MPAVFAANTDRSNELEVSLIDQRARVQRVTGGGRARWRLEIRRSSG
jgi:hypothetical protein